MCGYHAEIGIATLIDKSLLTIINDRYGNLSFGMHDLLDEMGKHIVKQESPNDLSKCSRLWSYKDVDRVLTQNKEFEATHGIVLDYAVWPDLDIRCLAFSNICQLKFLILDDVEATILCYIPCTLKVLHWKACPMETLPFTDQRYELVEIDLSWSNIVQLWDGKKVLEKLEHLNLSKCEKLKQTPDLSGAPNLKTLHLRRCKELNYIHPSLAHHKSLVELNLGHCESLEILAEKLEMSSLKKLDLNWCFSLRRLPEFGECMKQLSTLTLKCTRIEELPMTFGKLDGLSKVDLTGCWKLTSVPFSLGCFVGLKELEICRFIELSCHPYRTHGLQSLTVRGCDYYDIPDIATLFASLSRLTSLSSLALNNCFDTSMEDSTFPYDLGHLASLKNLDLSGNKFSRVPISIHELPRLTHLMLSCCEELEVLPELPSSLRVLEVGGCDSLVSSNVHDAVSKACCGFAESASRDREDVLQMWIDGKEIPGWFEHQEEGNGVSVSFPHNFSSTETIALALCFLYESVLGHSLYPSVIYNGEEFLNTSSFEVWASSDNLYIVCVNGYCLSKLLCQDNRFQMLLRYDYDGVVLRSGAHWVCKQDIQDIKKRKSQTRKRKACQSASAVV